jgi:integrase
MLNIRKRGQIYYVRGTVRVGKETFDVKEQSTGFDKLKDAREYASRLEADIREHALNPNADRTKKTTFDDCLTVYLNKKRLKPSELSKIEYLVDYFEGVAVSDIKQAWNKFCSLKQGLSPASINRHAATLNSILNFAKTELNINPEKIKIIPVKNEVVFMLTDKVRPLLLSCYSKHARPIFTVFAYQGLREQENLQLQWEDVDLKRAVIFIRTSKNGESRQIPMHKKTWIALARQWIAQNKPETGHVWLNNKRKPYTDTRKTGQGGSPIRKAHINALRRLKEKYGISVKMNVHCWRHDWCARMVMSGVDLLTLQKIGGWKSLEMVRRYATFSNKHESDSINKI